MKKYGEHEIELDSDHVAFDKNNKMYEVYRTKESFEFGCLLGKIRIVFNDKDEIVSEAMPMLNLSRDFDLVHKHELKKWKKRITKLTKKTLKNISKLFLTELPKCAIINDNEARLRNQNRR